MAPMDQNRKFKNDRWRGCFRHVNACNVLPAGRKKLLFKRIFNGNEYALDYLFHFKIVLPNLER